MVGGEMLYESGDGAPGPTFRASFCVSISQEHARMLLFFPYLLYGL